MTGVMSKHWRAYHPKCKCEMCARIRRGRMLEKNRKWTFEDTFKIVVFVIIVAAMCILT